MCRRQQHRPLAFLLLLAQLWMGGAAVAFHASLHAAHARPATVAPAQASHPETALTADRADSSAPCPVCAYLKAVRGAVTLPHFHPALPGAGRAFALQACPGIPQSALLVLRSRAPPAL